MKFPKSEKLCNEITIQKLFKSGKAEFQYPFRLVYIPNPEPTDLPPQVVISISRKNFKKAVDRNWIRRRIREAYRLNKTKLLNNEQKYTVAYLGIMYVAKEKIAFAEIQKKLIRLLPRLQ
ncbi:MAG: ribonuclease P protein component [Microscillaceae bacterium]|jgi:ribonuclease P protein component|nr:ribonuclease P protein component [Microscillaceae bacterium]